MRARGLNIRRKAAGGRLWVAREIAPAPPPLRRKSRAVDGKWQAAGGRRQAAGGRWQVAGGRWQVAGLGPSILAGRGDTGSRVAGLGPGILPAAPAGATREAGGRLGTNPPAAPAGATREAGGRLGTRHPPRSPGRGDTGSRWQAWDQASSPQPRQGRHGKVAPGATRGSLQNELEPRQGWAENKAAMAHTYSCLLNHLVFSTQERRPWLDQSCRSELHAYLGGIARALEVTALGINGTADHVHLLLSLSPRHSVAEVVRELKSRSSAWLHRERSRTHAEFAWQEGYSTFSVSVREPREYWRTSPGRKHITARKASRKRSSVCCAVMASRMMNASSSAEILLRG